MIVDEYQITPDVYSSPQSRRSFLENYSHGQLVPHERDHENILVSADQCPHRLYILSWELARTDFIGLRNWLVFELLGQGSQIAREPCSEAFRCLLPHFE